VVLRCSTYIHNSLAFGIIAGKVAGVVQCPFQGFFGESWGCECRGETKRTWIPIWVSAPRRIRHLVQRPQNKVISLVGFIQ